MLRHFPVAAMALMLAASPLFAADPPADAKAQGGTPAERLLKALDEKITLDTSKQPFGVALDQIRDKTKIKFDLDKFTLQQMGYDPKGMPIDVKITDKQISEALRIILRQCGLAYAIIGDTIFISTHEMCMHRQMRQRINVDLDKVELVNALEKLKKETVTDIVLDRKVEKEGKMPVTIALDGVPLETAVRLMAEQVGLKPVRVGNVLFVTNRATARAVRYEVVGLMVGLPGIFFPYHPDKDQAK